MKDNPQASNYILSLEVWTRNVPSETSQKCGRCILQLKGWVVHPNTKLWKHRPPHSHKVFLRSVTYSQSKLIWDACIVMCWQSSGISGLSIFRASSSSVSLAMTHIVPALRSVGHRAPQIGTLDGFWLRLATAVLWPFSHSRWIFGCRR